MQTEKVFKKDAVCIALSTDQNYLALTTVALRSIAQSAGEQN